MPTQRSLEVALFAAILALLPAALLGRASPCEPAMRSFEAPADAFDFLIGEWDVLAGDKAVSLVVVRRALQDKALEMVWGSTTSAYEARSYIGFDVEGRWSQTWVDTSTVPFYLFYHGGVEAGVPTLYQTESYHESAMYGDESRSGYVCPRQRFLLEGPDAFVYNWDLSTDQGRNWKTQNRLIFRRR